MFGSIKKLGRKAKRVVKRVTKSKVVRGAALIAAPIPVVTTAFTARHPARAVSLVASAATGGAALPTLGAADSVDAAIRGGGAKAYLPAMALAARTVERARARAPRGSSAAKQRAAARHRAAARRTLARTAAAARTDPQAARALELARVAAQEPRWDREGYVRIRSWRLWRTGAVTRD